MDWLSIITFIINAIQTAEPLIAAIIAEIQALINGGQPVPPATAAMLAHLQAQQQTAYAMLATLPSNVLTVPAHKALLAKLVKP